MDGEKNGKAYEQMDDLGVSSILIGFSIINHPFWGTPIFGSTPIWCGVRQIRRNKRPTSARVAFFFGKRFCQSCFLLGSRIHIFNKQKKQTVSVGFSGTPQ